MLFPVALPNAQWSVYRRHMHGPFEHNGNLYAVSRLTNDAMLAAIWKSTDGGETWTIIHTHSRFQITSVSAKKLGSNLHVVTDMWSNVQAFRFNLDTETQTGLTAESTGATNNNHITGADGPFDFEPRSDNEIVVFGQAPTEMLMGTDYRRIRYTTMVYGGSVASVNIPTSPTDRHYDNRATARIGNETWFMFTNDISDFFLRRLTDANVLSSQTPIPTDVSGSRLYPTSWPAVDSTHVRIGTIHTVGTSLRVSSGQASPLGWGTSLVVDPSTESDLSNAGALATFDGARYAFLPQTNNNGIRRYTDSGGSSWSFFTTFVASAAVRGICAQPISTGIGVLYNDNDTIRYMPLILAEPPPPPPTGAIAPPVGTQVI